MRFRPYIRHRRHRDLQFHASGSVSYTPKQVGQAVLGIPTNFTGKGYKIAVIELGGDFSQTDLDKYFQSLLGSKPLPVVRHSVDGAVGASDGPNGADGEVMLDLCAIGAVAPGAEMHCYFAPNTDDGFLHAFQQARKDGMHFVSCSWGAAEDQWTPSSMKQFDAEFALHVAAGICITAAAGDNGSSDGDARGNHVDFPASSPNVLACGGTSLASISPRNETVWNDGSDGGATGGGVSNLFAIPPWQTKAAVPNNKYRGVPDVAAVADPETGISVIVDGKMYVIGGTSFVAPLMAAFGACLSEALGRHVGQLNQLFYGNAGLCYDVVQGTNGTYVAKTNWDPCTGWGVPKWSQVLAALQGSQPPPAPAPVPVPPPPAPQPTPSPAPLGHTITLTTQGAVSMMVDGKPIAVP